MRCVTNCSRLRRANCKPNKPGVTRLEPLYAKEQPRLYSVQSYKRGVCDGRNVQRRCKNVLQNQALSKLRCVWPWIWSTERARFDTVRV